MGMDAVLLQQNNCQYSGPKEMYITKARQNTKERNVYGILEDQKIEYELGVKGFDIIN